MRAKVSCIQPGGREHQCRKTRFHNGALREAWRGGRFRLPKRRLTMARQTKSAEHQYSTDFVSAVALNRVYDTVQIQTFSRSRQRFAFLVRWLSSPESTWSGREGPEDEAAHSLHAETRPSLQRMNRFPAEADGPVVLDERPLKISTRTKASLSMGTLCRMSATTHSNSRSVFVEIPRALMSSIQRNLAPPNRMFVREPEHPPPRHEPAPLYKRCSNI